MYSCCEAKVGQKIWSSSETRRAQKGRCEGTPSLKKDSRLGGVPVVLRRLHAGGLYCAVHLSWHRGQEACQVAFYCFLATFLENSVFFRFAGQILLLSAAYFFNTVLAESTRRSRFRVDAFSYGTRLPLLLTQQIASSLPMQSSNHHGLTPCSKYNLSKYVHKSRHFALFS